MRVFISADIEGTTFTTLWDETELGHGMYAAAAKQMTAEVKAACEGAIAAGADYILVNDAHDYAVNLDVNELPECVEVIRGWSGSPMGMVDGVDNTFDAAMFIGYHSAAGRNGNPLSHTFTTKTTCVKLNGMVCSEFLLYSWACAMRGVPCLNPALACRKIKEQAEAALKEDLSKAGVTLPGEFKFEISYKEHRDAVRRSFFPGCRLEGDRTVVLETHDFMDVLRAVQFIL